MNKMNYFKAFIAGIVVPSILIPVFLFTAKGMDKTQLLTLPIIHTLPLIWGLWNVFYFFLLRDILKMDVDVRLLITGALLGAIVSAYGVFYLDIAHILELPPYLKYVPLAVVPIVYALLWRYFVKPINELLGLGN